MFFWIKITDKCNGNNIIRNKQFFNKKNGKKFSEMSFFFQKVDIFS